MQSSNTPVEAVFDDNPRRNSLVFAVHMWNPGGPQPETIREVLSRHKDVQYSSRAVSHIRRQKQIHHLRRIIAELAMRLPEGERETKLVREMASYGCLTRTHVVRLLAPPLEGDDHTKDIDFSRKGIRCRWAAGYKAPAGFSLMPRGKRKLIRSRASISTNAAQQPLRWDEYPCATGTHLPSRRSEAPNSFQKVASEDGGPITRVLSYQIASAARAGALTIVLQEFEPEPSPVKSRLYRSAALASEVAAFLGFATLQFACRALGERAVVRVTQFSELRWTASAPTSSSARRWERLTRAILQARPILRGSRNWKRFGARYGDMTCFLSHCEASSDPWPSRPSD